MTADPDRARRANRAALVLRPPRVAALALCGAGAGLLLAVGLGLVAAIRDQEVSAITFAYGLAGVLSAVGIVAFLWSLFAQMRLRYTLGREALILDSAAGRTIVPLRQIDRLQVGNELLGSGRTGRLARWLPWLGSLANPRLGRTERFTPAIATGELVLVRTLATSYLIALAGADLDVLEAELPRRQEADPVSGGEIRRYPSGLARLAHWDDKPTHVLALGAALANALLFAYVCALYQRLPDFLPLHFNTAGIADYVGSRVEVWRLPLIGSATLALNFALGTLASAEDRFLARVLLLAAVGVQALLLVALVRLT
ncbi:MAG: DUF1648 domain-containing protein [Chloroflexi bacterium]|nr:DUF1648 domain-containing protein [Chloroflexota bacterium]